MKQISFCFFLYNLFCFLAQRIRLLLVYYCFWCSKYIVVIFVLQHGSAKDQGLNASKVCCSI